MDNKNIYQKPVSFGNIIKFTLPTMAMMIIQSLYTMVDGIFVSNIIGTEALSALTLIAPYFNVLTAIAAMFASGGSAVVMKKMGEGKKHEARQDFTMLLTVNFIIGIILTIGGFLFVDKLSGIFGASYIVTEYCNEYLFAYIFFIIAHLLFSNLQMYMIASGGSKLAMISSLFGGIFNVVFDYVLIKVFGLRMTGAAIASGLGMLIPCVIMMFSFVNKNRMLHFVIPRLRIKVLTKTATNGISEFSGNLVSGIVILLFNSSMLRYAGEARVAASTIIFYVFGFMSALYMGYMFGIAPLISYFYGERNTEKLRKLRSISLRFIVTVGIITLLSSVFGSKILVEIFTDPGMPAYELAVHGNSLFSVALLLVGINTFTSALFTALSNGLISAAISFGRTFVFLAGGIIILPLFWGIDGIWLSVPIAEGLTLLISAFFFKKYQKRYGY